MYGQTVQVDALMLGACENEFLIGEDFLHNNAAVMNFMTGEVTYYGAQGELVVLPFRGIKNTEHSARVMQVRLVTPTKMETQMCGHMILGVAAYDGEVGVFVPHKRLHGSVLLAPTVATVQNGKIQVPVLNAQGARLRLPSREALGSGSL